MILTNISLFSGVGGLDLGAKLVGGFKTVAYVEFDRYAQGVLMSRMRSGDLDDAPIFEDVRTFDGRSIEGRIDVVSGGFPCQDLSFAGKREGIEGSRSGLWKEYARIVGEVRPRFVLVENVPGLLADGALGVVLGDLASMGFDAEWFVLSAAEVGSLHRRDRVWVIAHSRVQLAESKRSGRTDGLKSSQQKEGSMHSVTLAQAVQMWPTPTGRDGKDKDARNRGGGNLSVKQFDSASPRFPDRTGEEMA